MRTEGLTPSITPVREGSPPSSPGRTPSPSSKRKYTTSGDGNILPGTSNIVSAPMEFVTATLRLRQERYSGNTEIKLDGGLRIIQSPFVLAGGIGSSITTAFTLGKLFDLFTVGANVVSTATKVSIIAGFIICGFEAIYESIGLKRALSFLCRVNGMKGKEADPAALLSVLESLDKRYVSLSDKKLQEIDKKVTNAFNFHGTATRMDVLSRASALLPKKSYQNLQRSSGSISPLELKNQAQEAYRDFLIQEKTHGQRNNLTDRVRVWKAQEVVDQLPEILTNLRSPNPTEQEQGATAARELLADLKIQGKKKALAHVISLTSIVFTVAGLALTIACPYAAVALVGIGMLIGFGRYFFNNGVSDTQGWNFEASNCVPEIVKKMWTWLIQEPSTLYSRWNSLPAPAPMFALHATCS